MIISPIQKSGGFLNQKDSTRFLSLKNLLTKQISHTVKKQLYFHAVFKRAAASRIASSLMFA